MAKRLISQPQGSGDAGTRVLDRLPGPAATAQAQPAPAAIRGFHVLILGALSAFGPLSVDMYLPALPALGRELSVTTAQTQLTLSAFLLGLALGQLIAGPISDALGRKRPLLFGVAAYALASLLGMAAASIGALTALRFVQGLAGSAGVVIALAIVRDLYAGNALARFFSLLTMVSGIAPIVAPVIGSQLLRFGSWRGIFLTLALIGLLMLLTVAFGLGETLPAGRRQRGGLGASLRTFRDLFADRRFVGYALIAGFTFAAGIIYISISPFILQNIYGVSPQRFGLLFGINALGIALLGQINARLVGRISPQTLLGWGVSLIAFGGIGLLASALSGIGLFGILPSFFVIASSLGLIVPNTTTLALADTTAAGSASAVLGVLQLAIGAIAAPLVGLAGTASAAPMASAIAAFGLATLATFSFLVRPGPDRVA